MEYADTAALCTAVSFILAANLKGPLSSLFLNLGTASAFLLSFQAGFSLATLNHPAAALVVVPLMLFSVVSIRRSVGNRAGQSK